MSSKLQTAERVSHADQSDNYVFQRSLLAYHRAAELVGGSVLEIGTGSGYGIDVIAPSATRYMTIDKFETKIDTSDMDNVEFHQMTVPPIDFPANSFDCVISFQVIEHIKDDVDFVAEVYRVLKPNGVFIVSTPNAAMSLTRNPWHVREYQIDEFDRLLGNYFADIERCGVFGNEKVMKYYEKNRASVRRITKIDFLDLQHRLPRQLLQIPYDILNRINRRRLLKKNTELTTSIEMSDYSVSSATDQSFDLLFVAEK
jgi:2-polyprenyl-3-methyl-5-hydroxy-6-metoxy-1,4-benzoquinol methylase